MPTVLTATDREGGLNAPRVLWFINVPLLAVCAVQVWNMVALGAFWPVLLLLSALFAIGCFSFVRLLLNPSS